MDLLLANIKLLLNTGLTPINKAQLSVLYSYLAEVDERINL